MTNDQYIQTVKYIKQQIVNTRYAVSKIANKELLSLYYNIGNTISKKVNNEKWGSKTIEKLSADLQQELKGLRGFSATNLKYMRRFYEEWKPYFNILSSENEFGQLSTDQLETDRNSISQLTTDKLQSTDNEINQLITNGFNDLFIRVSFTAHYEILVKTKTLEERIFYISQSAMNIWTIDTLKHHLKTNLYKQRKTFPNNFSLTIADKDKSRALASFKNQYLLDFISLSDEEAENERVLESRIVENIKKFLMSLGNDFAFMGNQYRLLVDEEEFFIDLLFFNRKLQALVAFELKTGKFKPEYLGKMNFYLTALDEKVKQEHEKPSIGIILCKEKSNKIVEFSFRDYNKAMGVATYETSKKLPDAYKNILPDAKTLKKLMD